MTDIIVDLANLFSRARHVSRGTTDEKVGLSLHTCFTSIRKAWKDFDGTHLIFALEGRSWRKDFYPPYKRNRAETRAAMTANEVKEDQLFWQSLEKFQIFLKEKTNSTVLQHPNLEADDLISGWIQYHPERNHVIISTDGDFAQLISENVRQYNGVTGITTTISGYYDDKGKPVIDKKTNLPKIAPDPEWLLFEKIIRGDTSDNVFSAYPGVREKGSKNKVGLREAYQDRITRGYNWNNLMLQRWVDHLGQEHRVIDDYNRNKILCDLKAQPDDIKQQIQSTILQSVDFPKSVQQVGIKLIKFCSLYDLQRISDQVEYYAAPLNAQYKK
jgi:5'-3' exonuclease